MDNIYENKDLCSKCGGYCCKRGGCDYSSTDFETLKIDYLQTKLEEGYISIVSYLNFKVTKDGKVINHPFLFLRARNINRPIVDLLSLRTTCKALINNKCLYDIKDRPTGGVNFIPKENNKCYPLIPQIEIVNTWNNYQNILNRLVKRITGKNVYENLKIDVENLFYDFFIKNFTGILEDEIKNMLDLIPTLIEAYPEEYKKAKQRFNSIPNILILRK